MHTLDLTDEQLAHVRKLLVRDVAELQVITRSDAFAHYGPDESEQMHAEIRIGLVLIGKLPPPRKVA